MSEIDIERKESGGVPWWAWLLGALLLLGLLWYAIGSTNNRPEVAAVATGNDTTAIVGDADNSAMMADNSAMMDANAAPAMDGAISDGAMANGAMTDGVMANGAMTDGAMADKSMSNSAENNSTVPMASNEAITNILSVVDAKEPAELYGKTVKLLGAPVQAAGAKVFWIGPSFEQKMLVVTDGATNMNGINTGVAQRDRVNIEGTIREITDFQDAKAKYNLDDAAVTYLTNKKVMLTATSVSRDKN